MKIDAPANENYCATVVRLPVLHELENSDNLLGAPLFGFQSVVDKSHTAGELGIVFPAECQLSEDFCRNSNLYRHSELNLDPEAKGYLEDNRRVRAIKLRGNRSDCLFLPITSLSFTGVKLDELKEGMAFDTLNGVPICQKYVVKTREPRNQRKQEPKFSRVDPRLFPQHDDTQNYWKNRDLIHLAADVYVTQKLHGTSFRAANTRVLRKLSLWERIARKLGVRVDEHEWDVVAGSRKVIKDPNNPEQQHHYGSDIWSDFLPRLDGLIPENYVIYGELVGWVDSATPIQTNYTYDVPVGTHDLYVYRVAFVNHRGLTVDLTWSQVLEFCRDRNLKTVPTLWKGQHSEFVPEEWIDRRLAEDRPQGEMGVSGSPEPLSLGPNKKLVDEGVCVRMDGLNPVILKAKSPVFLAHETRLLDKGEENMEDAA